MRNAKLKDYFRIHVDISSIIIILLLILIFYRQAANLLFKGISFLSEEIEWPCWMKDVSINVISEIIGFFILLGLGFIYFRMNKKPFFAGEFITYQLEEKEDGSSEYVEWGSLMLTYNIFTNQLKGIMISKKKDICLKVTGEFDKERYFRGTYVEKDKPSRLRLGAFLMLLDSDGDNYEGSFMFVSPTTTIDEPQVGKARWEKEK